MPLGGFLALLDDVSYLLDDIASMTKIAAGKTSAIVGDDLALNAKQLINVEAHRELSVVYAVAKGSLRNKAILVPLALFISAVAPLLITPLLMIGGAFLCYEGVEKILHSSMSSMQSGEPDKSSLTNETPSNDPQLKSSDNVEQEKIKSAIRTDFILSAEIIAITLGAAASAPFLTKAATLIIIGFGMTVVVYGLVAAIVKADDLGLYLIESASTHRFGPLRRKLGIVIVRATPRAMRALSVIGTLAMFSVGGGIIAHGISPLHHIIEGSAALTAGGNSIAHAVLEICLIAVVGVITGLIVVSVTSSVQKVLK
jgi:predicted DNA repair protein MutK